MTVTLWTAKTAGPAGKSTHCRAPGTDICLSCPLPTEYIIERGVNAGQVAETCEQANYYNGHRKSEPVCLLAFARFYGIDFDRAEEIAHQAGLHPDRPITADRYKWLIRLEASEQ